MKRAWMKMLGAIALSAVLGSGCDVGLEDPPGDEAVAASQQDLWAKSDAIAENRRLDVCWNFDGWDHEKQIVEQAVHDTWMRYSEVNVSGWGRCGAVTLPGDHDIEIDLDDSADANPHSPLGGTFWSHMHLNFTFNQWNSGAGGFSRGLGDDGMCNQDQAHRDYCIYVIAAHEFGHALGFSHEANRADGPEPCPAQGTQGDLYLTPWDSHSIMMYVPDASTPGSTCNPRWNNWGELSTWDIVGVQRVYGSAPDAGEVEWSQFHNIFETIDLGSTADKFCVLTHVTGEFRGNGEGVFLRPENGRWKLTGRSQTQHLEGRARCVPTSLFESPGFTVARYQASTTRNGDHNDDGATTTSGVCAISGMTGPFDGAGNRISLAGAPDTLSVNDPSMGNQDQVIGEASCASFWNRPSSFYSWSQGQNAVAMIPVAEGICYLTEITGAFYGGEAVEIVNANGTYYLSGQSWQQGVSARAACIRYPNLPAPTVRITSPGDGASSVFGLGNSIRFTAAATDAQGGDASAAIVWSSSNPADGPFAAGPTMNVAFGSPGARVITATTRDRFGLVGSTSITFTATDTGPTARIDAPVGGASFMRQQTIVFTGVGSDPVTFAFGCDQLRWTVNRDPAWSRVGCSVSGGFDFVGPAVVTLTVTNPRNHLTGIASVTINLAEPPHNSPPLVTIVSPTPGRIMANRFQFLNGDVRGVGGAWVQSIYWSVWDGQHETSIGTTPVLNWRPDTIIHFSGNVELRLHATDSSGLTTVARVTLFVAQPPH